MQKFFTDATDMGKLYINYPMIESYKHLKKLPDYDYSERKIPVSLQPGKKYKALVDHETVIDKVVEFPHRIDDLLNEHYGITDEETRKKCCKAILDISDENELDSRLQEIVQGLVEKNTENTLKYQLRDWITKLGYAQGGQAYWKYLRDIFKKIVYHNICKANRIQNNQYEIEEDRYKEYFEELDLVEILKVQNAFSQDVNTGFIWVLNTCVFLCRNTILH